MGDRIGMNIISASRRTDIPAFYTPWLLARLEAGFARYPNPFNNRPVTVSLRSADVHTIVFWSRNFEPLIPHLDDLARRDYRFFFHFTITGAPPALEQHAPPREAAMATLRELAARTSPHHVQWRFDPILLTDKLDTKYYVNNFRELASGLAGATERCAFSFATLYPKVDRRLRRHGVRFRDPSLEEKRELAETLAAIGAEYGIGLHACCQDALLSPAVRQAHCIDGGLLQVLSPDRPLNAPPRPTRPGCGCTASRDIGVYDTCVHGCLYCYANTDHRTAAARFRAHDPLSEALL
jgi:DNA repair photolyase